MRIFAHLNRHLPSRLRCAASAVILTVFPATLQAASGTFVYFENQADNDTGTHYQICTIRADGTANVRIDHGTPDNVDPSLSPDGSRIVYQAYGTGVVTGLYLTNPDGTNVTAIPNTTDCHAPVWSFDGTKIVAVGSAGDNDAIVTINADGSNRVTRDLGANFYGGGFHAGVGWSPDGTKIVFIGEPYIGAGSKHHVYIANADGTGTPIQISTDATVDYDGPSWSPDGTKIVVQKFGAAGGLYLLDPTTGAETAIGAPVVTGSYPTWSPDGTQIGFESEFSDSFGNIGIVNPDGSNLHFLTTIGQANSVKWSAAGSTATPTAGALVVPGTTSIFLAGQPAGTGTAYGGTASVQVPGLTLTAGTTLTFDATGTVSQGPGVPAYGPDGSGVSAGYFYQGDHGLSGLTGIGFVALVGVFVADDVPVSSKIAPPALNYASATYPAGGADYTKFQPALNQVFFIGDGKDASGNAQTIVAPTGATRLFLGVADSGSDDDSGQFAVTVHAAAPTGNTFIVPGMANLWLAGQPNGVTASQGNDYAPEDSPTLVTTAINPGADLTFAVTGPGTAIDPSLGLVAADGSDAVAHAPENGIGGIAYVNTSALIGVFLDASTPVINSVTPDSLDYSGNGTPAGGANFGTVAPALRQVFFIGDGVDANGTLQHITVPAGATRLYLGTADNFGWYNNIGSLSVTVNSTGGTTPPVGGGGSLIVPGTANPYLAGLPDGTTASGGDDTAPAQSPVLVPGLALNPNKPLNFSVGGSVSNDPVNQPTDAPDGEGFFAHNAENSFNKIVAPLNSLVGVFLSDTAPDPAVVSTTVRDFSDTAATNGGTNFTGYQPDLGTVFFIGDGKNAAGVVQNVFPPAGATRLFLGVLDGNDYFNNLGQFNVGVTQNTAVDASDLRLGQNVSTPTSNDGSNALIGDQITYTFHLKNEGSHTFTNLVVKDVLPGVCEFVSASDGGTVKGGVVTWNLGSFAPTGASVSKDLTLTVKTFATGDSGQNVSAAQINQVINNLDYYVTGDGLPQVVAGLDVNNATILQAPISVAISSNGSSVTPGGTLSYTIDLKNTLGTKIKKPVFSLTLPAGVKFVSAMYVDDNGTPIATVSTDGGLTFTSDAGSFALNGGGSATFTVANLKGNATAHLVLTVQVPYDVLPDAAINFGAAKLTTKTSDELGQNSYGVAVPNTKLSGTAGTNVPALALLKIIPDPVTISQAIALESATEPLVAAVLQTVFPENFDKTLDKVHKTLNPNVVDGTDDNGFYEQQVFAPGLPNSPADATMTLAVVCTNIGAAKVGGATIQDRVPDGTEFVAGSAMLNGVAFDPNKLTLSDNNRTLVFNLGAIAGDKPGKPSFRILTYQVRLLPAGQGGLAVGSLLTYGPAQLNTPSLFHTTVSTEGAVRVTAPAHLFFEPTQFVPNPFPGDTVTYEAYYKNTGSVTVDDASIVDVLPTGATNVQAVFTLGDTGTVGAVANGQLTITLPTLKKKAEGRVRITATLTTASFNPQGSLVTNRLQLFSAALGAAAARADLGHATTRGRHPRDVVLAPLINAPLVSRLSGPGLAKLFVTLSQPLAVKEGDTFDCIVAIANPTDIPATLVGAYLNVPLGATFVSASQTNATTMTETDGTTTVYFPPTATGGFVYTVPAHGSLLKKATLRALGGTGGKALPSLGARSTNANFNYVVNGTAGGGVYAPVYSGATEIFSYPANQSFNTVKSQVLTAALAAKGLKVPEIEGLPDFKTKAQALTADALGIVTGGADGIAFENNVVVIPLLAGQALAIGSANGLLFDAGALKNAGGNSLISQDGGGLVAQGGGNLIKVANLVAQGGGNLVGSGGRDVATILNGLISQDGGGLVAQGGGNLIAQGGGNLITGGGGNLIAQGGGNLVAQGGGNLIGHLIDNTSGLISPTLASSLLASNGLALAGSQSALIAQGGGNLVAQGGGNLVAQGGGNLIATGGGNLIAQGGGNLVAQGGGNLQVSTAASQAVLLSDNGLVAQGGGNLISQDGGGLISQDGGGLFGGNN